ncbi:MAG TPA: amidohydrolase [Acidimicrobiaceae bacterium]|nr:amidohydrolase [Acidimicrobiaceae bacterium]
MVVEGRVFTADPDAPWAEALVARDGVITYVGTLEQARAVAADAAEAIEAAGVVLPGFIDAHAHVLSHGHALRRASLRPCTDLQQIHHEISRWLAANSDAPRVLGVGWTFSAVPGSTPTRHHLDAVVADRPVYLDASDLHSVWVNTAALAELGITDDTPDPIGGRIVRDAAGHATGLLLENAGYHIAWPVMNRTTSADNDAALQAAIAAYLAGGTTAAVDMALDTPSLQALLRADSAGRLPFTVVAHWLINRTGELATELEQVTQAAELAAAHSSGRVRVAGIKLITDGTIDGCTAGMCQPFTNGEPGEMVWPRDALEPVVLAADEAGLQIAAHAIGDLAVRTVLDVFEVAAARRAARGDTRERRHRIEHLEYVDTADVARLAPLGVTASMQPVHCDPAYLDNWEELLGPERAQRGFAWPEYLAHGTTLAFGTDTPTADYRALLNMYIAATRRSPHVPSARPLRPDWALPMEAAVVHGTRDAAWASFEERRRGMLRVGLTADLCILDGDPFEAGPEALLDAAVTHTVVNGRVAYRAS